jgi:hypothetical protein
MLVSLSPNMSTLILHNQTHVDQGASLDWHVCDLDLNQDLNQNLARADQDGRGRGYQEAGGGPVLAFGRPGLFQNKKPSNGAPTNGSRPEATP